MLLTQKPKRIHLTFRDPAERRSKTVTFYDCTLEQALEQVVGKPAGPVRRIDRATATRLPVTTEERPLVR